MAEVRGREFEDMTRIPVPLDTLLARRRKLIADVQSRLDDKAKRFPLTLQDGEPDFKAIDRSQAVLLPAAQRDALLKLLG